MCTDIFTASALIVIVKIKFSKNLAVIFYQLPL